MPRLVGWSALSMSLGRRVTLTLSNYGVSFALGIVASILVARAYGPSGKGLLALAAAIPVLVYEISKLGLHNANAYFSAKEPDVLGRIYANSVAYSLLVGLASAGALLVFAGRLGLGPSAIPPEALAAVAMSLPFVFAFSLFSNTLVGSQRTIAFNAVLLASNVLPFALVLAFVRFGRPAVELVVARATISMLLATTVVVFCLTTSPDAGPVRPSIGVFARMLRYGIKPYVASLLSYVIVRSDVFLVNYFMGPGPLGVYSIDGMIVLVLLALPTAVGLMMMPRVARLPVDERVSYFEKTTRVTLGLVLVEVIIALLLVDRKSVV